jgi:pyruvate/2-oxoglutarate dehydrogenase complex dihydrolipoamide acyltransferase (E2) component
LQLDAYDFDRQIANEVLAPRHRAVVDFKVLEHLYLTAGVEDPLFADQRDFYFGVINQPNVAILGCGRTEERVVAVDGMIGIRPRAHYILSFDHRLVNGSDADLFMKTFKENLEGMDQSAL